MRHKNLIVNTPYFEISMNIEEIVPANTPVVDLGTDDSITARWVFRIRPQSYWDVVGVHLPLALITGIPLLISYLVPLKLLPMIPCTLLRFTGYPCPFCGFTRAFWAISNGAWSDALLGYPLAGLLYVLIVFVFIWNTAGLLGGIIIARGTMLRFEPRQTGWIIGLFFMLFLINWAYRLSMGFL
jgi:hypothetical protein